MFSPSLSRNHRRLLDMLLLVKPANLWSMLSTRCLGSKCYYVRLALNTRPSPNMFFMRVFHVFSQRVGEEDYTGPGSEGASWWPDRKWSPLFFLCLLLFLLNTVYLFITSLSCTQWCGSWGSAALLGDDLEKKSIYLNNVAGTQNRCCR